MVLLKDKVSCFKNKNGCQKDKEFAIEKKTVMGAIESEIVAIQINIIAKKTKKLLWKIIQQLLL